MRVGRSSVSILYWSYIHSGTWRHSIFRQDVCYVSENSFMYVLGLKARIQVYFYNSEESLFKGTEISFLLWWCRNYLYCCFTWDILVPSFFFFCGNIPAHWRFNGAWILIWWRLVDCLPAVRQIWSILHVNIAWKSMKTLIQECLPKEIQQITQNCWISGPRRLVPSVDEKKLEALYCNFNSFQHMPQSKILKTFTVIWHSTAQGKRVEEIKVS